jgi:hypothetical protein
MLVLPKVLTVRMSNNKPPKKAVFMVQIFLYKIKRTETETGKKGIENNVPSNRIEMIGIMR